MSDIDSLMDLKQHLFSRQYQAENQFVLGHNAENTCKIAALMFVVLSRTPYLVAGIGLETLQTEGAPFSQKHKPAEKKIATEKFTRTDEMILESEIL